MNANRFYLFFITILTLVSCTSQKEQARRLSVVQVNEASLSAADFANELAVQLRNFDALMAKDPKNISRAKESVIMDFVHKTIVQSWARENKISVNDKEIEDEVNKIRGDYPDDNSFRRSLAAGGLSFGDWKKQLKDVLTERKVFEKIRTGISEPTDLELRSFYRDNTFLFREKPKVRLKQVMVEKEEDATRIRKGLIKADDADEITSKLGQANQVDPSGDTGWIEKGTLEVFDKAFSLRKGRWSPVLKSAYGYHIYKVLDTRPARQLPFEKARDKIRGILLADREQAAYSAWLEEQIRLATVLRNDSVIQAVDVETIGDE